MKTVLILAAFGAAYADPKAEPEADPAHLLLASPYYSLVGKNIHGYVHPTHGYSVGPVYSSYLTYGRKKRSADAEAKPEAEADPALLYGSYYGLVGKNVHGYVHPTHGYSLPTYTYPAYSYLTYGRKKRSAEAESEADSLYSAYYSYPYYGYGSSLYYPTTAYTSSYSYPTYSSYFTYGRKKRSADAEAKPEAEADPALLYGSYYGLVGKNVHGYVHPTHGYSLPTYTYPAYSYLTYGRKKRSAETESEADPLYSAYYSYPYYGYGSSLYSSYYRYPSYGYGYHYYH